MDHSSLYHPLKVKDKIQETPDTVSFVLSIPTESKTKFRYKAGQFLTVKVDIGDQEVSRSYSLSSCPEWVEELKFTVKRVKGGLMSNHLIDVLDIGDTLMSTPPAGRFCLSEDNPEHLLFVAGGSGITPIFSLVKSGLKSKPNSKILLIHSSRSDEDCIFGEQIHQLATEFPERLQVENVFSRQSGRLHATKVKELLEKHGVSRNSEAYTCGPEGLMSTAEAALELFGVPATKIYRESFSSPVTHYLEPDSSNKEPDEVDDTIYIGDIAQKSNPETISACIDGEWVSVTPSGELSVLESLLEAGHNPPYSCMNGACMACLGKVEDGLVWQADMGILTDDNTLAKECLTCQAHPASKNLKINFDI